MKTISKITGERLRLEILIKDENTSEIIVPEVQIVGLKYRTIYGMVQIYADVRPLEQSESLPSKIENIPLYELIAGEGHEAPPICSDQPQQR